VSHAANKYGPKGVLVTSFTKAAAVELARRNTLLHKKQIGTLHSICARALGGVRIAEVRIGEWNREHPKFRLSVRIDDEDDLACLQDRRRSRTFGDGLYESLQILRARMVPAERWPQNVESFAAAWTAWKKASHYMDFTDLLETALLEFPSAPGNPSVIVADEAQDLSPLHLALLRQWAQRAEHLLLAGDDDQGILVFTGADPEALLAKNGPEYFRIVLSQSYRVPRAVQIFAEAWVQQLTRREPKPYQARPEDGEVGLFSQGHYRSPQAIVDHAETYLAHGKRVLFLATCSYMLEPLKRILFDRGLPFSNPYRRKRPDWNPLDRREGKALQVERLLAYLRPRSELDGLPWRAQDLLLCLPWLHPDGILTDDAIQWISSRTYLHDPSLSRFFRPEALEDLQKAMRGDLPNCLTWWLHHLKTRKARIAKYYSLITLRHGTKALKSEPQIIIGTVHSIKGGEADVVYFFPDLSATGIRQWASHPKERDAVIRLAYVAMTRARESLIVCQPAGPSYIPLQQFALNLGRRH
jgi:superfamily I DNA/RNA helicase